MVLLPGDPVQARTVGSRRHRGRALSARGEDLLLERERERRQRSAANLGGARRLADGGIRLLDAVGNREDPTDAHGAGGIAEVEGFRHGEGRPGLDDLVTARRHTLTARPRRKRGADVEQGVAPGVHGLSHDAHRARTSRGHAIARIAHHHSRRTLVDTRYVSGESETDRDHERRACGPDIASSLRGRHAPRGARAGEGDPEEELVGRGALGIQDDKLGADEARLPRLSVEGGDEEVGVPLLGVEGRRRRLHIDHGAV